MVTALRGRGPPGRGRRVRRRARPVGERQDDAAEPDRRARRADRGRRPDRRGHDHRARRAELFRFRRDAGELRVPDLQPVPDAHRAGERAVRRRRGPARPRGAERPRRCSSGSGWATGSTTSRSQLSGGEQQRVAIARALATGNPVLLADEPTGELDFRTGVQILELLHEQAHTGVTVMIVTHNREICRVADRVVELSSGTIVQRRPAGGRPGGRSPSCAGSGGRASGSWLRWSWRDLRARWVQVAAIALDHRHRLGHLLRAEQHRRRWRRESYDASYAALHMYDLRVDLTEGSYVAAGRARWLRADAAGPEAARRRSRRGSIAPTPGRRVDRRTRRSSCPGRSSASTSPTAART